VVDGDLFKPLLVLSLPIVAQMLLQVGYNLADTFWVGRLGAPAVAALSYSWAIVFLMVSIGGGLTVAGTVLVAQHKGAGNRDQSHHVAGQTLSFVTLVALACAILGYIFAPTLIQLVGATPGTQAYEYTLDYVRTMFVGVEFMFWFFIFSALMRGWGDTTTPLYLMAGSVALNLVLDPFLILGFEANPLLPALGMASLQADLFAATGFAGMGVQGAAVATIFSRGAAALVGLYILFSGRVGLRPAVSDLKLRLATVRQIVDIGVPTATEQGMRALGLAVLTAIVALAGSDAVASYGIVQRLGSLVFLPALGLARGTETVVGQNLGARKPDRAKRAVGLSAGTVAGVLAVASVVGYIFAEPIVSVFIEGPSAAPVIEMGAAYFRIAGPAFALLGIFQITLAGFRGSGSTRLAMLFSIQELWLLRIPVAYVLLAVMGMGVIGVWWAIAASFLVSAATTGLWFLRGTWAESVVDEDGGSDVECSPGD
jgi:putative MATE family efflux protein